MTSELWQRIRAIRKATGKTQEVFGAELGASKAAVSQWEAMDADKRTMPTIDKLKLMAQLSGAPLSWLLDDSSELEAMWWVDAHASDVSFSIADDITIEQALHRMGQELTRTEPAIREALAVNLAGWARNPSQPHWEDIIQQLLRGKRVPVER